MQVVDAISREAVLRVIDGWYEQNRDTENIEDLIILITYMQSVQPSRKGHWIRHKKGDNEFLECDKCKTWFRHDHLIRNSFCPNCGTDMRGDTDEHSNG